MNAASEGLPARLSADNLRFQLAVPRDPPKHLDAWLHRLIGRYRRRAFIARDFLARAHRIVERSDDLASWESPRLRRHLQNLGATARRAHRREPEETWRAEALAAVREAARRSNGLAAHPNQIAAALALGHGCLAEVATGEGKTLAAALAAVLAGWTGLPCHIVTVNDYLADRDARWFGPLMDFCGLRAAAVTAEMDEPGRRAAHAAHVTYATSKELTADFLRDRLRTGAFAEPERRHLRRLLGQRLDGGRPLVLRGLHHAIIDEADSVLIDEAVTPLILSRPAEDRGLVEASRQAHRIAAALMHGTDYRVDHRYREIEWRPEGTERLDALCEGLGGIWRARGRRQEILEQALLARELFHPGEHYVVQDGGVIIVDSFTGRLMAQRTWSDGLQQAVELKEGLEPSTPTETLARLSFQRFFRLFPKLSGMTGTAREAADEFWHIYRLPVIAFPTHAPVCRRRLPDHHLPDAAAKEAALLDEIAALHATGQPLLVGLRNIEQSERLAACLTAAHIPFRLLNARLHAEEAAIIGQAGVPGAVTLATNMAGRGTDIRIPPESLRLGGLRVLAAERQESARIDRQLFGRCARQGDPGVCQAFVCPDDDLPRRFASASERALLRRLAALPGTTAWATALRDGIIHRAQRRAEAQAFRRRQQVLRADIWIEDSLGFRSASGS